MMEFEAVFLCKAAQHFQARRSNIAHHAHASPRPRLGAARFEQGFGSGCRQGVDRLFASARRGAFPHQTLRDTVHEGHGRGLRYVAKPRLGQVACHQPPDPQAEAPAINDQMVGHRAIPVLARTDLDERGDLQRFPVQLESVLESTIQPGPRRGGRIGPGADIEQVQHRRDGLRPLA